MPQRKHRCCFSLAAKFAKSQIPTIRGSVKGRRRRMSSRSEWNAKEMVQNMSELSDFKQTTTTRLLLLQRKKERNGRETPSLGSRVLATWRAKRQVQVPIHGGRLTGVTRQGPTPHCACWDSDTARGATSDVGDSRAGLGGEEFLCADFR